MTIAIKRPRPFRLVVFLALLGMVPTLAQDVRPHDRDPHWAAPAKDAGRSNPLANHLEAAAGGRKLFQQRCATCHGGDGRGSAKAPDLTQPDVQAQSDGALYWKIGTGNTHSGMPAFSFLPEPRRWQLVLHLRALAAHDLSTCPSSSMVTRSDGANHWQKRSSAFVRPSRSRAADGGLRQVTTR